MQINTALADPQARVIGFDNDNMNRANRRWSLVRLASLHLPAQEPDALDGETEAGYRRRIAHLRKRAGFAKARAAHIAELLHHRHGGPCDTDDAAAWIVAALPYVIEAAEIEGRSAYVDGLRWVLKHSPGQSPEPRLAQVAEKITALLEERAAAIEFALDHGKGDRPEWLPAMTDLVRDLRPTFREVTELGLRGWGSIDRPAEDKLKVRKTDLQRQRRREKGVQPMSQRTRTAELKTLAESIGVNLRTVQRWEEKGTTAAEVAKRRDVAILKHPLVERGESFTFVTRPDAVNDDQQQEQAA